MPIKFAYKFGRYLINWGLKEKRLYGSLCVCVCKRAYIYIYIYIYMLSATYSYNLLKKMEIMNQCFGLF